MGFDYALVHLKYTIPPAIVLTALYRPFATRLDVYKVCFLIAVAVTSTIPWDSYLIRTSIWSYPGHVVIGPTLFDIPLEEVFFFIVQTYNTSLLYLLLSKPTFQPVYLRVEKRASNSHESTHSTWFRYKLVGQLFFVAAITWGWYLVKASSVGTYTGLILVWAGPFLLMLWTFAYQFILGLPLSNTLIPFLLPTLYLWIVDTLALKRGTWVINPGTKYSVNLWDGLDIEEALFFAVTNLLIVFGQLAFDNALSVLYAFPKLFPDPAVLPSPLVLMQALSTSPAHYDEARLNGLQEAVARLKRKSRSFYLASSTFQGQIRSDLMLLYSFCRVADDLVDEASSAEQANEWIKKLHEFLHIAYDGKRPESAMTSYVQGNFPKGTQSALLQLPYTKLSQGPLQDLLRGFEMDLAFNSAPPIVDEAALEIYAQRVAGTVAQMCNELIFYIYDRQTPSEEKNRIIEAGNRMGIALQYVNIARDIAVDAKIGRVYLPITWLKEAGTSYDAVLKDPNGSGIDTLRSRLLDKAFALYEGARGAIEELPLEARGPLRVAVESYMEIGRVLRQKGYVVKAGRATVSKGRRLRVAWSALNR